MRPRYLSRSVRFRYSRRRRRRPNHLQKAAAAVVVLLVIVEVGPEIIDSGRQEGNLDGGAASILLRGVGTS